MQQLMLVTIRRGRRVVHIEMFIEMLVQTLSLKELLHLPYRNVTISTILLQFGLLSVRFNSHVAGDRYGRLDPLKERMVISSKKNLPFMEEK